MGPACMIARLFGRHAVSIRVRRVPYIVQVFVKHTGISYAVLLTFEACARRTRVPFRLTAPLFLFSGF